MDLNRKTKERLSNSENVIIKSSDLSIYDLKRQLTNGDLLITKDTFDANLKIADTATLKDVKIMAKGSHNTICIEDDVVLENCSIWLNGDYNTVIIGHKCNCTGTLFMCGDGGNAITLGEKTTISGAFWGTVHLYTIEKSKIEIGEDCMFSGNIAMRTMDGHSIIDNSGQRMNLPKDINIGNHVWIGMNSTILKGAHIATGGIVGANSVVTKQFNDDYTIIAGNPAVIIKSGGYDWRREKGFDFSPDDFRNY